MTNNTYNSRHPIARTACCALIVALLASAAASNAAEYYRWKDEAGVVHMSDKRPDDRTVETIKPRAQVPRTLAEQAEAAEAAAAEQQALEDELANAPAAVDENASKELRCQQERERLGILKANSVVHMQDANGNLKKLTEAQIQQEIAVTQKAIDALCK